MSVDWVSGKKMRWSGISSIKDPHGHSVHFFKTYSAPVEFPDADGRDGSPALVVMRLDRRLIAQGDTTQRKYACRLWCQRLKGTDEIDEVAHVLVDDLGIDEDTDLYPCVYASRPESDIRHAVKLRGFPASWESNREIVACRPTRRADSTLGVNVYGGMTEADPTVGLKLGDKVRWTNFEQHLHGSLVRSGSPSNRKQGESLEHIVPDKMKKTEEAGIGIVHALANNGSCVEVAFNKFKKTLSAYELEKADELGQFLSKQLDPSGDPQGAAGISPQNSAKLAMHVLSAFRSPRPDTNKDDLGKSSSPKPKRKSFALSGYQGGSPQQTSSAGELETGAPALRLPIPKAEDSGHHPVMSNLKVNLLSKLRHA